MREIIHRHKNIGLLLLTLLLSTGATLITFYPIPLVFSNFDILLKLATTPLSLLLLLGPIIPLSFTLFAIKKTGDKIEITRKFFITLLIIAAFVTLLAWVVSIFIWNFGLHVDPLVKSQIFA